MTASVELPPKLSELVDDFSGLGVKDRLQLLLELSQELPALPERYAGHRDAMEQVPECQTPLFLAVEVDPERTVHLFFDAPPEAPTTRGFASISSRGRQRLGVGEHITVRGAFGNLMASQDRRPLAGHQAGQRRERDDTAGCHPTDETERKPQRLR